MRKRDEGSIESYQKMLKTRENNIIQNERIQRRREILRNM